MDSKNSVMAGTMAGRLYETPTLTRYGSIGALTQQNASQGKNGSNSDGSQSNKK